MIELTSANWTGVSILVNPLYVESLTPTREGGSILIMASGTDHVVTESPSDVEFAIEMENTPKPN